MNLMPESMSQIALGALIESALRTTALIALAALAALALRRAPAATRHLAWTLALIGCVGMPLASRLVPGWSLPLLPSWGDRAQRTAALDPTATPDVSVSPAPATNPGPAESARVTASEPAPGTAAEPALPGRDTRAWRPTLADVPRFAPIVWLAGVVLVLGRHLLSWATLMRIARRAAPVVDPAWQSALARHGETLGLTRLPAARVSTAIDVPIVCGALRPTILLPADAPGWTDRRRDAVLLHELAHVRRFDLLTARFTLLAAALYWFNPFVWLAARRQRAEAERACDDQVLDAGGRASTYASDLLEIAQAIDRPLGFDAAALAMARRSQLEGRLLAILDPRQPRGRAGRIAISFAVLIALGIVGVLAAARPAQSRLAAGLDASAIAPTTQVIVEAPESRPAASIATQQAAPAPPVAASTPKTPAATSGPSAVAANPPTSKSADSGRKGSSWSIIDDGNGEMRSGSWKHADSRGSYRSRGQIRFNPELNDVESISSGGYIEIEDRRPTKWHRAIFKGRSGGIERSYTVDGEEQPWDDDARAWLGGFLIELDRGSGTFAEQRFPRLMNEGGPQRVLREVSEMGSDYGRGIYFKKLLATNLDGPTLRQVVTQAGREIESDYELTQVLIAAANKHALEDAGSRAAYLGAVGTLQSDYEHGRALQVLVARRDLADALVDGAIESASGMESDYEQAQVMVALAEKGHVKPARQRGFMRATYNLDSDYERGRVLRALIDHGPLAGANLGEMLLACGKFQSDYERANVLINLAETVPLDASQRAAFIEATKGFSSDYERGRALAALGTSSGR